MSDVECLHDEDENYIWDDSQLNNAYDKALKMPNFAMSTNTYDKHNAQPVPQHKPRSNRKKGWKVGEPCRAVYDGDGLDYEAFVKQKINDNEYIVKFYGYGNSEVVTVDNMKTSLGKRAQWRQIENSTDIGEETDERILAENMELGSDRSQSPARTERSSHNKDENGFQLPYMSRPMPMPNFDNIRNLSAMDMPLPEMAPPPLGFPCGERVDSEDDAVSSMLLSWYICGYYTGLYQGLKRSKEPKRRRN